MLFAVAVAVGFGCVCCVCCVCCVVVFVVFVLVLVLVLIDLIDLIVVAGVVVTTTLLLLLPLQLFLSLVLAENRQIRVSPFFETLGGKNTVNTDVFCAPEAGIYDVFLRRLAQHSRHFGLVRSLSLWRGAHFEMPRSTVSILLSLCIHFETARATFSSLSACQIALVAARCSFQWSRRSCAVSCHGELL